MSKDHYLPAGFIGRFSAQTSGRLRNRQLWVNNFKAGKTMLTTPSAVGYKKGLYSLGDGSDIDKWSYENSLNAALGSLARGETLTLDDWLRVAVPFVAGLFVRGKEFNKRYEAQPVIKELTDAGILPANNTNVSRAIRLQRLLAPVCAARWVVLHSSPKTPTISNDLGFTLTQDLENGDVGWAIPIDHRTVLGIFPRKQRVIGSYANDTWHATVEHLHPDGAMFEGINEKIALAADEFIFGSDQAHVESFETIPKTPADLAIIMEARWDQTFTRQEYIAHEKDWRVLAAIANLNLTPQEVIDYVYKAEDMDLQNKWVPPMVVFPSNLTTFPSGIALGRNQLLLDLRLLDSFEGHVIQPDRAPVTDSSSAPVSPSTTLSNATESS